MSDGKRVQMPSGDKDEAVQRWLDELDRGIKMREKEEKRWLSNEKFEDMKQWDGNEGSYDEVTVNKLGSYINTFRSRISFNDPRAKLTPRTSDGWEPIQVPVLGADGRPKLDPQTGQVMVREVVKVKVREALLNDILSAPMHNTQAVNSRLVKAGILGWGCLKSGYSPTFKTDPKREGEQSIEINDDGSLNLDPFAKNAVTGRVEVDEHGQLLRRDMIPIYEDFFIRWVPYRNMIIDPDGGNDWSDHRWVAEEYIRPWKEVKEDPLFKNTDDLKPSGYRKEGDHEAGEWQENKGGWAETDEDTQSDAKIVRLFEVYDLVNERILVLADGHGQFLRDDELPLGIPSHPYSDFRPNEVLGKFYPRPLATDLCPINGWYNIARQMELRAMKRSTRKGLVRKGYLDTAGMNQLTSDEDMAFVEVDVRGNMSGLNDAIVMMTPPPISEAIYINSQKIAQDFDEVGGLSETARGKTSGSTATQINVQESYSGSRIDFYRKVLAETWRRAIKKVNDSVDANMTVERAVQLEGSDGMAFVGLVDNNMIAGDFDVMVDVEDMAPTNSAMEGAQLIQFIQVVGQNWAIVGDEVLAREFLSKFGIKNERVIQALVKQAQMQMQMAMAQAAGPPGPVPNAPAPTNEADALAQAGAGMQSPNMQRGA